METFVLTLEFWVRCLIKSFGEGVANGGSPLSGGCPASEDNDEGCLYNPDQLRLEHHRGGGADKLGSDHGDRTQQQGRV